MSQDFNISIIGYGFVGSSFGKLCEVNDIKFNVCDNDYKSGKFNYFNNVKSLVIHSEKNDNLNVYIISVPTPSDIEGKCDISIVENVLTKLNECITKTSYILIKSTMVPSTCDYLHDKYTKLNIVFCPEFLRESTCIEDMYFADFVLLGFSENESENKNKIIFENLSSVFEQVYCHNENIKMIKNTYKECELFKYSLNVFLATKVWYFNKIYQICDKIDIDYQKVKELYKLDSRIGEYGTIVPGPDKKWGFGKKCLKKESKGMVSFLKELDIDNSVLTEIVRENKVMRNTKMKNYEFVEDSE